jgi:hypothetical protein
MKLMRIRATFIGWRKRAPRYRAWAFALALLLGFDLPAAASALSPRFVLYDGFNGRLINPARWVSASSCGPTSLECTQEIRAGALALRVRTYGGEPDEFGGGSQFASSALALRTDRALAAMAIAAHLQVRATSAAGCPTNADDAHGQALITGTFFNGGSGDPDDDVTAYLQLDRYSFEPEGQVRVGGFLSFQGQFFGNVELGLVDVREAVQVQLIWDAPGGRFLVRLFPRVGPQVEAEMPYAMPVAGPPAAPQKTIQANVFVPNCSTGPQPFAEMDVRVEKVLIAP